VVAEPELTGRVVVAALGEPSQRLAGERVVKTLGAVEVAVPAMLAAPSSQRAVGVAHAEADNAASGVST